jgi:hypothetical protein
VASIVAHTSATARAPLTIFFLTLFFLIQRYHP